MRPALKVGGTMSTLIEEKTLDDGTLTRRAVVTGLTATAAAATAMAAASAQGAAAGGIERIQAVPGLLRPQANGKDIYSTVVTTTRTKTIYVAGQLARGPTGEIVGKGDMRAQIRQVGENIKAALAAAGATLDDVVQTSTFVTDWAEFRKGLDVRAEYFGASLPTSTTVQVVALADPAFMVEISVVAVVNG